MPPIPIKPGVYRFYAHIIGPPALITAREHAVDHGLPVNTDRPLYPPLLQEWIIQPAEPIPGSPYVISLAFDTDGDERHPGLVAADHRLWANAVNRDQFTKWTFAHAIGGLQIIDEKDQLALRAGHFGEQIKLVTPNKADFHQVWTLDFLRPIDE
ncbi:hypothetical protein [Streptomyces sp. NPDC053048]|uniref:hypothetical protein n=1 Tax=Streptomyces sp. NPDC053048 TaxID=3365694 RepID=UPI0037D87FD4